MAISEPRRNRHAEEQSRDFSDVNMDATYLPRVSNRSKRTCRNVLLFVRDYE